MSAQRLRDSSAQGPNNAGFNVSQRVSDYADRLQNNDGRLYLSGLGPAVLRVWESESLTKRVTGVQLYPATEVVGSRGTRNALLDASARRVHRDKDASG